MAPCIGMANGRRLRRWLRSRTVNGVKSAVIGTGGKDNGRIVEPRYAYWEAWPGP